MSATKINISELRNKSLLKNHLPSNRGLISPKHETKGIPKIKSSDNLNSLPKTSSKTTQKIKQIPLDEQIFEEIQMHMLTEL
jgi:hypothetical protein